MPTHRETILTALHARLSSLPATALRGEVLAERMPADGLLILRDGDPGEPEVTLSPLTYYYQHRAEIEAVVQGVNRDATFDALCASIGTVIATDRTLGAVHHRSGDERCLVTVAGGGWYPIVRDGDALPLPYPWASFKSPGTVPAATRASEPVLPTLLRQIFRASVVVGEVRGELLQRWRLVLGPARWKQAFAHPA